MPVLYADVVFAVNFVMDAVLLFTTCWVLKTPAKWLRLLLGGTVGATYALLLFVPSLAILTSWPGKAIVSLCIVRMAVPCRSWLQLAKASVTYYFIAFVFAGAAIALNYAVPGVSVANGTVIRGHGVVMLTSLKSLALLVAIPLGVAGTKYVVRRVQQRHRQSSLLYTVHASIAGKTATFIGLADTGNQLRDPISRKPVCFVDASVMRLLLPQELQDSLDVGGNLIAALDRVADNPFLERLALIPFRGAGGQSQLAVAVRPDSLELEQAGRRVTVTTGCLLAVHTEPLSTEGRFQAILHIDVLTGVDGCEDDRFDAGTEHETAHSHTAAVD